MFLPLPLALGAAKSHLSTTVIAGAVIAVSVAAVAFVGWVTETNRRAEAAGALRSENRQLVEVNEANIRRHQLAGEARDAAEDRFRAIDERFAQREGELTAMVAHNRQVAAEREAERRTAVAEAAKQVDAANLDLDAVVDENRRLRLELAHLKEVGLCFPDTPVTWE